MLAELKRNLNKIIICSDLDFVSLLLRYNGLVITIVTS